MKTLAVPHFRQQDSHTCLPACVRMVLAYRGYTHNEDELAQAFGTVPFLGTPPEKVVAGLQSLGYHGMWFENATLDRLRHLLMIGQSSSFYEPQIYRMEFQAYMRLL